LLQLRLDHSPAPETGGSDWLSRAVNGVTFWRQDKDALPHTQAVFGRSLTSDPAANGKHQSVYVPLVKQPPAPSFALAPPPPPRITVRPPQGSSYPAQFPMGYPTSGPSPGKNGGTLPIHHHFIAPDAAPTSNKDAGNPFGDEYAHEPQHSDSRYPSNLASFAPPGLRGRMPPSSSQSGKAEVSHGGASSSADVNPFATPFDDPVGIEPSMFSNVGRRLGPRAQ
jgi:hypothetical protein